MAVSTKTLTPTGQVVSIPDMTEKPNASVLSDGIGKEADAINALDNKLSGEVLRPSRSSNSVLTYAAGLSEGIHFYTTTAQTDDNPVASSCMFMIFRAATGITILGMPLGSRDLFINASANGGSTYSGWQRMT